MSTNETLRKLERPTLWQDGSFSNPDSDSEDDTLKDCSPLSPKSPSSAFAKTRLEHCDGCIIGAIVLAYWDNIIGPKIRHLWLDPQRQDIVRGDILNYVASHTLSGEICRDPYESNVDSRFFVVKERQIAVTAFMFGALGKLGNSVHSLAFIIAQQDVQLYLPWHDICVSWTSRLILKLRILLEKELDLAALRLFSPHIQDLVMMLKSLKKSGVPPIIKLSYTAFEPNPKHQVDKGFLRKAITSHLMTCGHSVVIGNSISAINMMIATLALFLGAKERKSSRLVQEDANLPYHPNLCLQGLLKEPDGQISSSLTDIYLSDYPTTLVDLSTGEVRHSCLCHRHQLKRHEALTEHLHCLWKGKEEEAYTTDGLFQTFDDPETLVGKFFDEISLLPSTAGVRESYVDQFLRCIDRKALALIKYVQTEIKHQGKGGVKTHVKKLKHDLSLTLPGDFNIVLAAAEKLKPGLYSYVCGDPKAETEQMQNILDTF